jgi:hypothetical protein
MSPDTIISPMRQHHPWFSHCYWLFSASVKILLSISQSVQCYKIIKWSCFYKGSRDTLWLKLKI